MTLIDEVWEILNKKPLNFSYVNLNKTVPPYGVPVRREYPANNPAKIKSVKIESYSIESKSDYDIKGRGTNRIIRVRPGSYSIILEEVLLDGCEPPDGHPADYNIDIRAVTEEEKRVKIEALLKRQTIFRGCEPTPAGENYSGKVISGYVKEIRDSWTGCTKEVHR